MSKRNAINPPPPPIPATPPACAEARAIAKREAGYDLQSEINENTPSWRELFKSIFGE